MPHNTSSTFLIHARNDCASSRPRFAETFKALLTTLVVCVSLLLTPVTPAVAAPPTFGNSSDFVGEWKNVNRNTRSISRVVITPGGGLTPVYVQIYGKCGSGECKWKRGDGSFIRSENSVKTRVFSINSAGYVFATRDVILRLESNGTLSYQVTTDFANRNRQDYVSTGSLKRS